MICPYRYKSVTTLQQWGQRSEEADSGQSGHTLTQAVEINAECVTENCGAFYDGRCHYKKVANSQTITNLKEVL